MTTLTPLLVKIGLANGSALYPDFNTLASVIASGNDWSRYVDVEGLGWTYDRSSGHDDDDPSGRGQFDSPRGQQWGLLLIPLTFANEAVAAFPAECTILSETDTESFWDDFAAAALANNLEDVEVLSAIASRKTITGSVLPSDVKALDPDDPTSGVRRNPRKTWARWKASKNITVG